MNPFKFLTDTKYITSVSGLQVPATTPIGIMNGYVTATLTLSRCVPYRVIINGDMVFESEVVQMSYNEYMTLVRQSNLDVRLCTVLLSGNRVYEIWNGTDNQISEYPSEFIDSPDNSHFIEVIKLPRYL